MKSPDPTSFRYFILYKPYGMLSQFSRENETTKTLADLVPLPEDVYPVGRLDKDSEGLLLLTNDKFLNNRLLHPVHGHSREYWVQVEGEPDTAALKKLEKGVELQEGQLTMPAKARLITPAPVVPPRNPPIRFRKSVPDSWISLTLTEGKNRQVRKMTAAVGLPTLRLIRAAIEKIKLGNMQPGDVRELKQEDVYKLLFGPGGPTGPEPIEERQSRSARTGYAGGGKFGQGAGRFAKPEGGAGRPSVGAGSRPGKPGFGGRTSGAGQAGRFAGPAKAGGTAKPGRSDSFEEKEQSSRPAAPSHRGRAGAPAQGGRPGAPARGSRPGAPAKGSRAGGPGRSSRFAEPEQGERPGFMPEKGRPGAPFQEGGRPGKPTTGERGGKGFEKPGGFGGRTGKPGAGGRTAKPGGRTGGAGKAQAPRSKKSGGKRGGR